MPGKRRLSIEITSHSMRALVDGEPIVISNDGIEITVAFTGSVAATLRAIASAIERGRETAPIGTDHPMMREYYKPRPKSDSER